MRVQLARTLSTYIARQFFIWFCGVFGTMVSVTFLLDYIELIRRGGTKTQATWGLLLEMATLKLPHTAQDVMPFAILFGTMLAFWRLTRNNELVVARAAGVSVWGFLTPAVVVALLIGVVAVTIFNPIASSMEASFEKLDNRVLRQTSDPLTLSEGGMWLRQSDVGGGQIVIHGTKRSAPDLTLHDVSVFYLSRTSEFTSRIEAQDARLESGFWVIENGRRFPGGEAVEPFDQIRLPTTLTTNKIEESLASPDTMSFWELPGFISLLEDFGLLGTAPSAAFQHPAGAAAAVLCDGAGGGDVQPADAAARRHHGADRERCHRRFFVVFPVGYSIRPRSVGQNSGPSGRLDTSRS